MQHQPLIMVLLAGLSFSGTAQALLIDRGGGLIYDDVLKITWLADANYAKTSGYDDDGKMEWRFAKTWAENLSYGGYSDWRLPTTLIPDPACGSGIGYAYNCTGSEMGHLFYQELGVTAGRSILTSIDPDLALFTNIQSGGYWSETWIWLYPNSERLFDAINFRMDDGRQGSTDILLSNYSWAVRPGDVAAAPSGKVPEPATLLLLSLGMAGLVAMRRCG